MVFAWTLGGFVLGLIIGAALGIHFRLEPHLYVSGVPAMIGAWLGWIGFRYFKAN